MENITFENLQEVQSRRKLVEFLDERIKREKLEKEAAEHRQEVIDQEQANLNE